jgi:hypothetical protein
MVLLCDTRLLVAKGVVTASELRENVEAMDARGRRNDGARLVARAWVDPDFKARLLQASENLCQGVHSACRVWPKVQEWDSSGRAKLRMTRTQPQFPPAPTCLPSPA